jgi:drug/metabolite transporter (DMT)-like permease
MLSCAMLWSIYSVSLRPLVVKYGYLQCTSMAMMAGAAPLTLVSIPSLMNQTWGTIHPWAWGALLFSAGAAIALAFTIWNYGIRRIGNARTSSYSNLTPVFGVVVAWLFLKEHPAMGQLVGMGAIFVGIFLTRMDRKHHIEEDISLSSQ